MGKAAGTVRAADAQAVTPGGDADKDGIIGARPYNTLSVLGPVFALAV
jgi:hypothetical protein